MGNLTECSGGAEEPVCSVCNPKVKGGRVFGTDYPSGGTGGNEEWRSAAGTGNGESTGGNPGADVGIFRAVRRHVTVGQDALLVLLLFRQNLYWIL
jgi:hypothetical protein